MAKDQTNIYGKLKMNAIFLDIDGVLNSVPRIHEGKYPYKAPSGCMGIDPAKVEILKSIMNIWDTNIILSSTWRYHWNNDSITDPDVIYMVHQFRISGIEITDKIHDRDDTNRGYWIIQYLNQHPCYDEFLIIDDDIFDFKEMGIVDHLLKTNVFKGGLLPNHIKESWKILYRLKRIGERNEQNRYESETFRC